MNSNVTYTSRRAYERAVLDGTVQTQGDKIMGYIKVHGPRSRQRIAEDLNIPLASVCSRVNAFIEGGYMEVVGRVADYDGGNLREQVNVTGAVPRQIGMEL
jgi:hypothetical protein